MGIFFIPISLYAAPDHTGQWDMGIKVGGILPSNAGGGNTGFLGGEFAYGINEWAAAGLSTGWTDAKLSVDNGRGAKINGGKFGALPIFADLIFRVPTPIHYDYLSPYAVLGLGTLITRNLTTQDLAGNNLASHLEHSIAFKLGAGLDWFMNSNWIMNFEMNYVFSGVKVDIINNSTHAAVDSTDLDHFYIGVGAKYLFT